MFKLLHRVMREETGDPTLRFHHLRHSFASRCFITLAASGLRKPARLVADLPGFAHVIENASAFRQNLYGNVRMTRRDVWAVCSLLGHSGPDVSMEHYIHLFDICLAEHMSTQMIAPRIAVIVAASGKSAVQAHRHRDDNSLHTWVAHLWRKRYSEENSANGLQLSEMPVATKVRGTETNGSPAGDADDSLLRIWRLLLIHETKGLSVAEIALNRGVAEDKLVRYLNNAEWLHGLKMSSKNGKFRHRFMDWVADKRHPDKILRILCPIKPHEGRDLMIVKNIAPKFREIIQKERHLALRVMEHYALNSRPNFAGMIFFDPAIPLHAQEFLRWLTLLGFSKRNLRFVFFNVASKRSKASAVWKKALGLHSSNVMDKVPPPNGRKDWACPWIGIEPIFTDETGALSGAAAFRFLMVMAVIATRTPVLENHTT